DAGIRVAGREPRERDARLGRVQHADAGRRRHDISIAVARSIRWCADDERDRERRNEARGKTRTTKVWLSDRGLGHLGGVPRSRNDRTVLIGRRGWRRLYGGPYYAIACRNAT